MKYALTVLASVVLALLATWYAIAARVSMLARAPEQATVLVVPGPDGVCVPRVARPVIKAHMDDTIEWRSVVFPGCEAAAAFDLDAASDVARLFTPALRKGEMTPFRTARVGHDATAGVTVTYTVELSDGRRDTARITFF
jgi:hypothetical protein